MRQESETRLLTADAPAIAAAADALRAGGLVAFPTETVYGLGADATSNAAVARIYAAKGRPSFNPLIAHVGSLEAARREGDFNADALTLARAFWPGPLTLVVPAAPGGRVGDLARAGLETLALRVPAHPVALALLAAGGAFYYYDPSNDTTGAFMGFACFPGFVGLAYLIIYFLTRDKTRR